MPVQPNYDSDKSSHRDGAGTYWWAALGLILASAPFFSIAIACSGFVATGTTMGVLLISPVLGFTGAAILGSCHPISRRF